MSATDQQTFLVYDPQGNRTDLEPRASDLHLEFCSASDARYKAFRVRHYVPDRGAQGRQLHFLIHYNGEIVGIISAGSATWSVKNRDVFFGITPANRQRVLGGVVQNTVFRLENHERHLASRIVALWRKVIAILWQQIYGCEVYGFETFVEPNEEIRRDGGLYRGDGWKGVGATSTGKLIYCKWRAGFHSPVEPSAKSSWRQVTLEEKSLARALVHQRKTHIGERFFCLGKKVVSSVPVEEAA